MKQTASYTERKKFEIFDKGHVLLYLNEQPAEIANEETGESTPGFSYTGDMPDRCAFLFILLVETKKRIESNQK